MTNPYLKKRSLNLSGHRTSVALEQEFWDILEDIAQDQSVTLTTLIIQIDVTREPDHPLSSALRLFALKYIIDKTLLG